MNKIQGQNEHIYFYFYLSLFWEVLQHFAKTKKALSLLAYNERDAGNAIINTKGKAASAIFSVCNNQMGVNLPL